MAPDRLRILSVIVIFTIIDNVSFSQENRLSETITSIAEEIAENEADPEASGIYAERLNDLAEKPVDLNSGDEAELSRLFFLTDFQIKALADYIKNSGIIVSVYELANIPGFDRELAEMTGPFITLVSKDKQSPASKRVRNSLMANFSSKYPASETQPAGPPWKLFSRYKFIAGKLSGGVTAEKDNGEKLLTGKPGLPDFLSANISWTGTGIIRKVIIGDYGVRSGLGTNVNTGLRSGLSLTSTGYLSGGDDIKPHTSADENNFFRGAAMKIRFKNTGVSFFYSLNRIDASSDSTDPSTGISIKTIYRSGLHNTASLVQTKDAVTETFYGFGITSDFRNLRAGLLWTGGGFSLPVGAPGPDPSDLYDFRGSSYSTLSLYYKSVHNKTIFFGEASAGYDNKLALVQGLSFRPSGRLNINFLVRNYDPGFTSYHGRGPFSSSAGDNVRGIFANFTFEAARHLFVSAGCDLRFYPWLKYRCSAPSLSKSSEMRMKFVPSDKLALEISYSFRYSMLNDPESTGIKKQVETLTRRLKAVIKYSFDTQIRFSTRVDFSFAQPSGSKGYLMFQDINYKIRNVPVSFWFRYCVFRTDSWESRLYTYENDLINSFSVPALSGAGSRSYLMVEWNAWNFADFRVKYSVTGNSGIEGTQVENRELRLQMRFWF